jgi:hypothetical protein
LEKKRLSLPPPVVTSARKMPADYTAEEEAPHQIREERRRERAVPASQLARAKEAMRELRRRKMEGLRLYDPLPEQLRLHTHNAVERVVCGSNRAGKSVAPAVEVAMCAMGVHRWGRKVPKSNGLIYVVGEHEKHIREVMYPKLRKSPFKIIKDEHTREWRPVQPDSPYDVAHSEKWKEAGPFIPDRVVVNTAWRSKKEELPESISLKNGTKIVFYTSGGTPQQGSEIDLWWADEELVRHTWIAELRARCAVRLGGGIYSFTPTTSTPEAYRMWRAANDPQRNLDLIEAFFFSIEANRYLSAEAKRRLWEQWTEADRKKRWFGQFDSDTLVRYPEFSVEKHVIEPFAIPDDWTRWMVTDPGIQRCGVLFVAVPPPSTYDGQPHPNAGEVHFYDELLIERCTAEKYAKQVKEKMGKLANGGFVGFLIDDHGSRVTMANGTTIYELYSEALARENIRSLVTDVGYVPGSDDETGRQECLRNLMLNDHKLGRPRLRVHRTCRMFVWQLGEQFFKRDKTLGIVTDKRENKHDDLVDCGEYIADLNPEWVPPPTPAAERNPILEAARKYGGDSSSRQVYFGPR